MFVAGITAQRTKICKCNEQIVCTHFGAGSPSASHSIRKGLSFSFDCRATWKSCSSVGGCFIIFGGECTIDFFEKKKMREINNGKRKFYEQFA